jgi:hypothetical protein
MKLEKNGKFHYDGFTLPSHTSLAFQVWIVVRLQGALSLGLEEKSKVILIMDHP